MSDAEVVCAWIAYLDIWGFSHAVLKTNMTHLTSQLSSAIATCKRRLVSERTIESRAFFFSDSMFLAFPVCNNISRLEAYKACRDKTQEVIQAFVDHNFLLRGAIGYGEIAISADILIGPPVINAVKCEQAIIPPLVVIPLKETVSCLNHESPLGVNNCSMIKTKDGGIIRCGIVESEHIDTQLQLMQMYADRYLSEGPAVSAGHLIAAINLLKGDV